METAVGAPPARGLHIPPLLGELEDPVDRLRDPLVEFRCDQSSSASSKAAVSLIGVLLSLWELVAASASRLAIRSAISTDEPQVALSAEWRVADPTHTCSHTGHDRADPELLGR